MSLLRLGLIGPTARPASRGLADPSGRSTCNLLDLRQYLQYLQYGPYTNRKYGREYHSNLLLRGGAAVFFTQSSTSLTF